MGTLSADAVWISYTEEALKDKDRIIGEMQDALQSPPGRIKKEIRRKIVYALIASLDLNTQEIRGEIVRAYYNSSKSHKGGLDSIEPGLKAVRTKYGHYIFYKLHVSPFNTSATLQIIRILNGTLPYMVLSENFIAPSVTIDFYGKANTEK